MMGCLSCGARREVLEEFEPVEILRSAWGEAELFLDFRTIFVTFTSLCCKSGYD